MNTTLEKLGKFGVVPVVVLDDAKDAAPLAKALCDGGLACAEVTFRTDAAEESIRIMTSQYPEMVVGLPMIKALAAPYNMMQFMPTGGISAATLCDYLRYEKIFACGGSWMVKGSLITSGAFDKITELTKEAVELVHSVREV